MGVGTGVVREQVEVEGGAHEILPGIGATVGPVTLIKVGPGAEVRVADRFELASQGAQGRIEVLGLGI